MTHSGLFQFKVMPFGLCNAPATFERLMDRVLQGLRWSRCLVYLDDIISFGMTFDDALDNLTLIFERLRSYGLQLKSTKCHLFQTSVPFLGHVVGREGLQCDPKKIEDVKSWPVPGLLEECAAVSWLRGILQTVYLQCCRHGGASGLLDRKGRSIRLATSLLDGIHWIARRPRPGTILSFPRRTEITFWTQTLAILAWEESSVRYKTTWSASSLTAVEPYDRRSGNTVLPRGKCWPLSLCVYSFVHIYVE